jgi:hypothetical protein
MEELLTFPHQSNFVTFPTSRFHPCESASRYSDSGQISMIGRLQYPDQMSSSLLTAPVSNAQESRTFKDARRHGSSCMLGEACLIWQSLPILGLRTWEVCPYDFHETEKPIETIMRSYFGASCCSDLRAEVPPLSLIEIRTCL